MARPTGDKKEYFIGIRVNEETKAFLDGQGSTSDYIRDLLDNVKHNGYVKQNIDNVKHNDDSFVKQLQERITKLEADNATKQERIAELEFLNDADYVDQLKAKIEELNSEIAGLKFLVPEYRDEVEKMADMTCGVENFYKSVLEKVEREEMDFNERGFELTDTEVVEALRNNEIREQLEDMRKGCEEKQVDKVKAMTRALKQGLVKVRGEIWGIKN